MRSACFFSSSVGNAIARASMPTAHEMSGRETMEAKMHEPIRRWENLRRRGWGTARAVTASYTACSSSRVAGVDTGRVSSSSLYSSPSASM